jgi:hypothetical protein
MLCVFLVLFYSLVPAVLRFLHQHVGVVFFVWWTFECLWITCSRIYTVLWWLEGGDGWVGGG